MLGDCQRPIHALSEGEFQSRGSRRSRVESRGRRFSVRRTRAISRSPFLAAPGAAGSAICGHGNTRKEASGSCSKARRSASCCRSNDSISLVEQLPRRIQTTFGGCPRRKLSWWKSESLDTIAKPCAAAYCQTASSSARPSPTLRTWLLFGNISAREGTSRCDRFWSKSRFTLAESQGGVALDPLRMPNRRGYPRG